MGAKRTVFLDRDGVLIENHHPYLGSWNEVQIFPQAVTACRELIEAGYELVVITNQAVVGRGHLPKHLVMDLHQRILDRYGGLGSPISISYVCTHRPDDNCECRKPRPGSILQAAKDHNLDLSRSYFVGDAVTDMQAAEAAGVEGILVRTGRGTEQEPLLLSSSSRDWIVCDDLKSAAETILARDR